MIYIDDFLDGMLTAIDRLERYAAINIASGQGYSVRQILETILRVDGFSDADVRFDPTKPSTIAIRLVDISRARNELGFKPRVNLQEGLSRTISWYRKHRTTWTK